MAAAEGLPQERRSGTAAPALECLIAATYDEGAWSRCGSRVVDTRTGHSSLNQIHPDQHSRSGDGLIGPADLPGFPAQETVQQMASDKRILVIEDDREISSTIVGVLEAAGYNVLVANNGIDGRRMIEEESPHLVITDMMMPRMGGFPVLEFLKTLDSPPRVIMITANEGGRHKAYAEMLGVDDYLRKPFPMDSMLESVARVLESVDAAADEAPLKRSMKKSAKKKSS